MADAWHTLTEDLRPRRPLSGGRSLQRAGKPLEILNTLCSNDRIWKKMEHSRATKCGTDMVLRGIQRARTTQATK
eukprot:4614267-Pyramimonas_sp.AAC.1